MPMGWSKPRYSPIAIDFGADSLKLLQIIPSDPPQLVACASAELPEKTRNDPSARRAFYGEVLKKLLAEQPFKGRRAICSIPAYQTLVQHLQIPRGDQRDFESQIELHLRERLNVNPSRMVIRHYRVGEAVRDGTVKQEVICLATSRDAALRHIELAHRAKLDVVGMHSEPFAILKAFEHLHRHTDDQNRAICFIDIGAATTKVVIAHGSELAFAKNIHAAGNHFTRQAASQQGVSFSEARQLRISQVAATPHGEGDPIAVAGQSITGVASAAGPGDGFGDGLDTEVSETPPLEGASTPEEQDPGPAVEMDAEAALDCLIDELQLCVRYYCSTFPDRRIEKLVFLGGESHHLQTCQAIARATRIGAQLGDPMARLVKITQAKPALGINLDQPQPGWAVPLGLCLCEANL